MRLDLNGTTVTVWRVPTWLVGAWRWVARPFIGGTLGGITFGHLVVVMEAPADDLLWHESVHAVQADRCCPRWLPFGRWAVGDAIFLVKYLWAYARHGYRGNIYEREAYAEQDRFLACQDAGVPCSPTSRTPSGIY